jgi:hypothetical protein
MAIGAPKEGLTLRIEAKWPEYIIRADGSALQFGKFSELFATPSRLTGLQAPICTHRRCSVHRMHVPWKTYQN